MRPFHHLTAAFLLFSLVQAGCSGGVLGGNRVDVRDGVAVAVMSGSGKEYKLGKIEGDTVTLFNTYGGGTMSLAEVRSAVSGVSGNEKDFKAERRSLANALSGGNVERSDVSGIWIVQSATVDGKPQAVRPDDPNYLVIRGDQTYRIIKKGRKPTGTWVQNSDGDILLRSEEPPGTADLKRQPDGTLQLSGQEGRKSVVLTYARTELKDEPKAADE